MDISFITSHSTTASPPQVFNTPWPIQPVEPTLADYFSTSHKIDQYAIIEMRLQATEFVQIVVDSQMSWLKQMLATWQKQTPASPGQAVSLTEPTVSDVEWPRQKLTLDECLSFMTWLETRSRNFELFAFLGLAPHKKLDQSQFLRVFYLDDLKYSAQHRPLVFALILQILIEQTTKFESRLVAAKHSGETFSKCGWAVIVRGPQKSFELIDPLQQFNWSTDTNNSKRLQSVAGLTNTLSDKSRLDILNGDLRVLHPKSRWNAKEKSFSIFGGDGRELKFAVIGRSPAEKRFAREQQQYEQALSHEQIPLEIGFHPFWRRLGHTTVRIGESLYELSSHGWKVHSKGADSARAYLFNNPFFKTQYQLFAKAGMPPASLGATLLIEKSKVEKLQLILENLVAADGKSKEKFSLMRNNCNQGIMRVFKQAGIEGFEDKGYIGFSSILSFRRLLVDPRHPISNLALYPLPGTELSELSVRNWIPRLLYRHNTVAMEMFRAIPSLLWDAVVFFMARINKFLNKRFKVKMFRSFEPYVMNT